nr:reverse transcriptase domain-containing protein [Tanacetum cinerariifolium]
SSKIQEVSQHSESRTSKLKGEHGRRRRSRSSRSMSKSPKPTSVFSRIRRDRSESPRHMDSERETVFTRLGRKEKGISNRLGEPIPGKHYHEGSSSQSTKAFSKSKDSGGGHWKSRLKKKSQALKKTTYPNHGEGESTEDFVQRFKSESRHVKGALEYIRISGFMHGITNPELIKHLHDNISKSVDEMMRATTAFLRGEVAASNQAPSEGKKSNGFGHRTPHWFQRRNHMANRTNITIGKNRGYKTFKFYMDELCGGKITISIQWDHREAMKQTIAISFTLTEDGRKELCGLLGCNIDIFAWKPTDMTGVTRHIVEHRLNIREGCPPVRQKKTSQASERNKAIQEEKEKLVESDIMKEVHYHSWLANSVMVKKHENSWRIYVDFKDLNNACPKDGYPLLEIDWKVESFYPCKCFLDAYKGYHQIKMAKEDEEKTAFITSQGTFYYSKMPFKVYVDDLVIKSCTEQEIIGDIEETFKTLRKINMKPNPKKCTFGVEEGMFLGYKHQRDKTREAVSAVLMTKREAKQTLIYFVIHGLKGPEINYTQVEKLVLALVHESKRLKRYFQAHPIVVITDQPIKQVLSKPKIAGRLHKLSIEVGEYDIHYRPRVSIKGQILADFIVERPEEDSLAAPIEVEEELPDPWTLFMDGSSYIDGSRAGRILTNPEGTEFTYALRFEFEATNNEVEYEALIAGLRITEQMGIKKPSSACRLPPNG